MQIYILVMIAVGRAIGDIAALEIPSAQAGRLCDIPGHKAKGVRSNPPHYLASIEIKPNAFRLTQRRRAGTCLICSSICAICWKRGRASVSVQVPPLLEAMPKDAVTFAVTQAVHLVPAGVAAVKPIALAVMERRAARLDLTACPLLP